MQERHLDRLQYFEEQAYTSEKYIIPFINNGLLAKNGMSVLEIGCGEGGNLKPFLNAGYKKVVGVDISAGKIENADKFFQNNPRKQNIKFICSDIYEVDDIGKFDLIIMRDLLEHIHDQNKFIQHLKKFLKPAGKVFLGFPPWHNPFGGHQQMCKSKILSKTPYFHILPVPVYKLILKIFGESDSKIQGLLEIKSTRITIERFEKILKKRNYKIDKRLFYLINPNYEIKFKLQPRKQSKLISSIPYIRNFFITTNYYLISLNTAMPNIDTNTK